MVNQPAFRRLDDDTKRVRYLYQLVYQRDPRADEIERGLRVLQDELAAMDLNARQPLTPWERYGQVLLMSNELLFID